MHGRARQRGQTAVEYLGVLVLVASLVAVLVASPVGVRVRDSLSTVVCSIAGGACTAPADTGDGADPPIERAAHALAALRDAGAAPADVAALFRGLDPATAAALTAAHPDLVGNTDGAPIPLRFAANAARIRAAGIDRLDDPSRHFLLFDPAGDGRVAEVFGDLTTATNVAIVVPGVGNDLPTFSGGDAARLQAAAEGLSDGGTATVQWLGYDAPDSIPAGVSSDPARAGGSALPPLVQGIEAQRPGEDLHTTVIGHSYGSTVLGRALADSGLSIDDTVVVGSPGMDVDSAADLGDGAGTVWAAIAAWDPIVLGQVHGPQPAYGGFGATRFETGDVSGHSSYFQEGSLSLHNLALIAAGRPQDVVK